MTKIKKKFFNKIIFFGCILIIPLSMFIQKLDISSWLSLVLGIIFAIIIGNPFEGKTDKFTSSLLKTSVVFIGFDILLLPFLSYLYLNFHMFLFL